MQEGDRHNKRNKIEREGQVMIDPQINNVDLKFLRSSVTYTGYVSQSAVILYFSSTATKRMPTMDPQNPSSSAVEGHHLMQIVIVL